VAERTKTVPRFRVYPRTVWSEAEDAAGLIWRAVRAAGLVEGRWGWNGLPADLEQHPGLVPLSRKVAHVLGRPYAPDPQLILRLPEIPTQHTMEQYRPHVDEPLCDLVAGVPLTSIGNVVQVEGETIRLAQGDIITWPGDALHTGTPNTDCEPRLLAYWRW
jgi:hypothetical protein